MKQINSYNNLENKIKSMLILFIIFLVLSGITAFPLEQELRYLLSIKDYFPARVGAWLQTVALAIIDTNAKYPFMSYGTDWLAFAHLVIAVAFIGPLRDPVRNIWVIQFGMIACVMIFPLAFICGALRHIPFYWQLIDCSFGVFGFIPLYRCYRWIKQLELLTLNK
jgi:hypothetical protein